MSPPLVSVRGLIKHQALRPLRLEALSLARGEVLAIGGVDAQAAELLVGLLTGALLPDQGEVHLFGQSTSAIADSDAWLRMLDGVGIVTDRAVLIAQFSVEQNVAMPFTLEVEPIPADVRPRVELLAEEVGIARVALATRVAEATAIVQARVRLARALAFEPAVLLLEHPSASLPREDVRSFAADVGRIGRSRNLAVLALTADELFARGLGGERLILEPATGALRSPGIWRKIWR